MTSYVDCIVQADFGSGWDTDFINDVLPPVSVQAGIRGGKITDRIASPGTATFSLNNSGSNYTSTQGYWSPKNSNVRANWGKNVPIRIGLQEQGGSVNWFFYGKVKRIDPNAGIYGGRRVDVTVMDFMDDLQADSGGKRIAIKEDYRSDEAYGDLITAADSSPEGTDFSTGVIIMPAVFHRATGKNVRIYEELNRIATSNFEYVYLTHAGYIKSQSMTDRLLDDTVQFTLNNTMKNIQVAESTRDIPRAFTFLTYPTTTGTTREVIASVGSPVRIDGGETVTFEVNYRDPSGGSDIAGKNILAPVANTDYTFSTIERSQSGDYNSNLDLTVTEYATMAEVVATNNGGSVAWLDKFELRGIAIRTNDEVSSTEEISGTEGAEVRINLYYVAGVSIGKAAAVMATNVYGEIYAQSVSFKPQRSSAMLTGFLGTDIGKRIALVETVTGVDNEYFINGYEFEWRSRYDLDASYMLAPARSETPFIVGTSEVGGSDLVLFSGG